MITPFGDDFEEAIRDLDFFSTELVKIIENELNRLLRDMEAERNGESSGKEERQGCGVEDRKHLGLDEPLDPIASSKRVPPGLESKKPLRISKKALAEMTEPLMDVFEDESAVNLYVELPGIEKEKVSVSVHDGRVEVRAGNLRKIIELPTKEALSHIASFDYRNGVLRIMIPKRLRLRPQDAHKVKKI